MSKEERRRAFAEAAAAADESRRQRDRIQHSWPTYWPQPDGFPQQMFPGGMVPGGPNMLGNMPNMGNLPNMPGMVMAGLMPEMPADWLPHDFPPAPFCPPFCMPQPNMMGMPGFPMGGFMFGQQPPFPQLPTPDQAGSTEEPKEIVLPSLWRSTKDDRGRTYYYHVKLRQPQWIPPPMPPEPEESSSEEEEEPPSSGLDSPLVRRQTKGKVVEGVNGIYEVIKGDSHNGLIPDHALVSIKPRKRRPGLVSERPISPRTEEDKLAGRLEVKRYKQTKEKLRRRREKFMQKVRLLTANKSHRRLKSNMLDLKQIVELADSGTDSDDSSTEEPAPAPVPVFVEKPVEKTIEVEASPSPVVVMQPSPPLEDNANVMSTEETARKIKEQFRCSMARVMVQHLNPFRHPDAPAGRITCTADFKHLARKLTHFVMLKELKHCRSVDELVVTDSVRSKAKMFVKKYMAKFGPVYNRPAEEVD